MISNRPQVSQQLAFNSQKLHTKDQSSSSSSATTQPHPPSTPFSYHQPNQHTSRHLGSFRGGGQEPRRLSFFSFDSNDHEHSHNSLDSTGLTGHDSSAHEAERRSHHEITEMVDCGGRDLGFCDMNSRYPG